VESYSRCVKTASAGRPVRQSRRVSKYPNLCIEAKVAQRVPPLARRSVVTLNEARPENRHLAERDSVVGPPQFQTALRVMAAHGGVGEMFVAVRWYDHPKKGVTCRGRVRRCARKPRFQSCAVTSNPHCPIGS
jgi:hypothetical protein